MVVAVAISSVLHVMGTFVTPFHRKDRFSSNKIASFVKYIIVGEKSFIDTGNFSAIFCQYGCVAKFITI